MECQKPICNQHSVYQSGPSISKPTAEDKTSNSLCISCSKGQAPAGDWRDPDYWEWMEVDFDDVPIWINRRQRRKLEAKRAHKRDEAEHVDGAEIQFNSADEGLFVNAEDPSGWEQDMGAS